MTPDSVRTMIVTLVSPLRALLRGMVRRAVVREVDDSKLAQELMVSTARRGGEEDVEHVQPFGVSFHPAVGSEVVTLSMGGESAYRVALAAQHREKRPAANIEEGEGGLYLDGTYRVFLAADGTVHLGAQEADDYVALAQKVDTEIARIWNLLSNWSVAANDGGKALQDSAKTVLTQSVAATKVKAS